VRLPCAFVHRTSCGCAEPPRTSGATHTDLSQKTPAKGSLP
ncbi:LacI family transcriptional regulator, partial [Streptomyces sp. WAC08241]